MTDDQDDHSDYPPISDYAIIGDCVCAALISRAGSLDWLCLPHFSAPAVFAALLDRRRGGRFAVGPVKRSSIRRGYLGPTNVLETVHTTEDGVVRVTDCMPIVAGARRRAALSPQREVLRVIEGVAGAVEIEVRFEPRPNFARDLRPLRRRGACVWTCTCGDELFLLRSDRPLRAGPDGLSVRDRVVLRQGERLTLSLAYDKGDIGVLPPLGAAADGRIAETLSWWRDWSARCRYDGPHREMVLRSALVLKLLDFALSGAVVAAPTTSLPEAIGGSRNWDYRFCWLRDASLTFEAFFDIGHGDEGAAFLNWLLHTTKLTRPDLRVVYDVFGRTGIVERELHHLEGYRGSRPVRTGNAARNQVQLDIHGAVILAALEFVRLGGRLTRSEARLLKGFGDVVCRRWREPDHGIWEIRGPKRHHTYSKLMCWVALDRLIRLADDGHIPEVPRHIRDERSAIRATIEAKGYNAGLGAYVGVFGGDEADASLLLMARHGFLEPNDPRMVGTYDLIRRELAHGSLYYRYGHHYDGLEGAENAFGICSFWAVDYLARRGDVAAAARGFEELLGYANDVGLLAEEIDPATGQSYGNFPQAFTHIGLIVAAASLARAGVERDEPVRRARRI